MTPVRLLPKPLEKVWGASPTEPWARNPEERKIGEVWFTASNSVPLLVKFLFTSDYLSVQVHPDDDYARVHENGSLGKTEMWHVLRADPGARVAIGLKAQATREQVLAAALTGEIVDMLRWFDATAGDTFLIPAGTIHAIGPGLALCEVQELSDITYRLFDFHRGRELHLEKGLDVAHPGTWNRTEASGDVLADCPHFHSERLEVTGLAAWPARTQNYICVALSGNGTFAGMPFSTGDAWEIPAASGVNIESADAVFLTAHTPNAASPRR